MMGAICKRSNSGTRRAKGPALTTSSERAAPHQVKHMAAPPGKPDREMCAGRIRRGAIEVPQPLYRGSPEGNLESSAHEENGRRVECRATKGRPSCNEAEQ